MPDLRTAALAAGAWLGAAGGWALGVTPATALLMAGAAVVAGLRRELLPVVLIASSTLAAGAVGSTARQVPPEAVDRVAAITADVRGSGRQVDVAIGRAPAVGLPVRVTGVQVGGRAWAVDVPARVFADAADLPAEATAGAVVRFHGRIEAGGPTDSAPAIRLVTPAEVVSPAGGWAAAIESLRRGLVRATSFGSADASSLVSGIAIGDESAQRPELAAAMKESGLSHLTAVSGGNFVVILGAVLLIIRAMGGRIPVQVGGAGVALVAYGAVVGPQPSVLRASVMATVGLVGVLVGGASRGFAVLFAAVALLLLLSPELAWSLAFALSVAATAALQIVAPPLSRRLARVMPHTPALAVAVTLSAHVATAPLLLFVGSPVSWVAVPANLIVGPVVAAITVLGVVAALVAPVAAPLAAVPGVLAGGLAELIVRVAFAGQALGSSAAGHQVGRVLLLVPLGAIITLALLRFGGRRAVGIVAVVVSAGGLALLRATGPPPDWRLIVCDVGQGTAVIARSGDTVVLFDTGPERGDVGGCLARAGVGDLTAVVVSHFHADHVAGLPDALAGRRSALLVGPEGAAPTATSLAISSLAHQRELAVQTMNAGQHAVWGDLRGEVLWPLPGDRSTSAEANNGSLVVLLEWPDGLRVLIPGDIEPESQRQIMSRWRVEGVAVAVIPHHGSDHQDPDFAAWSEPAVAVASAGAGNSYGHPAAETVIEYEQVGALVHRTDTDGAAIISVQDGGLSVSPG